MVMAATTQYDRMSPWSVLGHQIQATDVEGIIKEAGLDFEVSTAVPVVNGTPAQDFSAIYRTDTQKVFGIAKKGYQVVQNREAFALLEDLLATDQIEVESAGTLKGGAQVWIQAKVLKPVTIPGDEVEAYLTISTSHDGSAGLRAVYGFLRIACTNQLPSLGRGAKAVWSHRHSRHVLAKSEQARQILGLAPKVIDTFEDEVRRLIEVEVPDRRFQQIITQVLPISDEQTPRQRGNVQEQRDAVRAMALSDRDGGGAFAGTGWGVVNAFNSWNQWAKPVKNETDRAVRQAVRTLDGTYGAMTSRVAEMVLA